MKMLFWKKIKKIILLSLGAICASSIVLVGLFRFIPVPVSAFMIYRHAEDLQNNRRFIPIKYQWVKGKDISPYAFAAVIASEDQLFFEHSGFDFGSIGSAIETYIGGGRLRGASTISQQVAKNIFLTPVKSFWRKGVEVWFTVLIELLWSKKRILEVYLNIVEFGDHLFGIEAASQRFFGIKAKQLSSRQAALLAATLPSPLRFQANKPTAYLYKRQNWILGQMKNLNYQH